jgi:hypothetical protein
MSEPIEDPEISAICEVCRALDKLPTEAFPRVFDFLVDRYINHPPMPRKFSERAAQPERREKEK